MKKIQLSLIAILATSTFVMAGGDIIPYTEYEAEDVSYAEAVPVTIPVEAEPIIVEPQPVVVEQPQPVVVEPKPVVVEPKEIETVSGLYAGLGISATRYDTNCGCKGTKSGVDKTVGVTVRAGYDFNKYVGLEARGLVSSINSNSNGTVKHAGVFLKPMLPVGDATNIYGLVGVGKTTTSGSLRRTDVTGLAFGAGIEYDLSDDKKKDAKYNREFDGKADQEKGLGVFADYERLYYKSGSPDLDAVSVGLTYDF